MSSPTRAHALVLGVILALAFGLRLGRWQEERHGPLGRIPTLDERTYDVWAQDLASGQAGERVPYQAPLAAYLLAGCHELLPATAARDAYRLLGVLLGVGTVALTCHLGRRASGSRLGGWIAGGLVACSTAPIYYEATLLRDGPATFAFVLAAVLLLTLIQAQARGEGRGTAGLLLALGSGLAFGVAGLLRENLLLVGVLAGAGLAVHGLSSAQRLRGLVLGAALTLGLAAPVVPWVSDNYRLEGTLSLMPTWNGGCVFYLANRRDNPTPGYQPPPFVPAGNPEGEVIGFTREAERVLGGPLQPHTVSRYWLRRGLEEVAADPALYAGRLLTRALYFVASQEYVHVRDMRLDAADSWVLGLRGPAFGFLVAFALVGGLARRASRGTRTLGLLVLAVAAVTLPVAFATRYRLPALPLIAALAACGLRELVEGLRQEDETRRRRSSRRLALALALGLTLTLVPVPYDPAQGLWNRAMAWTAIGRHARAAEAIDRIEPLRRGAAWARLGRAHLDNDQPRLAEQAFQRALELEPQAADAWRGLGRALLQEREPARARAAWRRSLALDPLQAEGWSGLALAQFQLGDLDDAAWLTERALERASQEEERARYRRFAEMIAARRRDQRE